MEVKDKKDLDAYFSLNLYCYLFSDLELENNNF